MFQRFELGKGRVRRACGACSREFGDRKESNKERKEHRIDRHHIHHRRLLAKSFCGFCGVQRENAFSQFDHMEEKEHGYEWMRMQTAYKAATGADMVELFRLAGHAFVETNTRITIEEVLASIAQEWPTAPPPDPAPVEASGPSLFAAEDLDSLTRVIFNNRTAAEVIASGKKPEEKKEEKHEATPVVAPTVEIKEELDTAAAQHPSTSLSLSPSSMAMPYQLAAMSTPSPTAIRREQATPNSVHLNNISLQIPDIGSDSDSNDDYHQKLIENYSTISPLISGSSSTISGMENMNLAGQPKVINETGPRKRPSAEDGSSTHGGSYYSGTEMKKQRGLYDDQLKVETPQPPETNKMGSFSTHSNWSEEAADLKDLLALMEDEEKWAIAHPEESKQPATGTAVITACGSLFPTPSSSAADGNVGVGVEQNPAIKMKEPISPTFSSSSMSSASGSGCSAVENIDPANVHIGIKFVPAANPKMNVNAPFNPLPHMQQLQALLNNLPMAAQRQLCAEEIEVEACLQRRRRAQSANTEFIKARVDTCPHCDFVCHVRSEITRRKHVASFHYDTYNFKSKSSNKQGPRAIDLEHYCMNNLGAPDEGPLSLVDGNDPQLQNKTHDREREMKNRACLHCPTVATSRVSLLLHLEKEHLDKLQHFLVQYRYLAAQVTNKDPYLEHFAEKYKGVEMPTPSIVPSQAPM